MKDLKFSVTPDVLNLGVKILTARVTGVQNSDSNAEFDDVKRVELESIKQQWVGKGYKDDPVLTGFRDLHTKVGRSNRDYVASPEGLRRLLLERGRFPQINTLVDIYNLISVKTGLALGAHDIDQLQGDVTLRLTKGNEIFVPLGKKDPVAVFPGEYAYVDDGNNVICRLEVLQVESTKVTLNSHDIFVIIQGNVNTDVSYVHDTALEVCELIIRFCGGGFNFF